MKVLQVLTTISFGDAVSNDTLALQDVLKEMGYETGIYAENIVARLPKNTAQKIQKLPALKSQDVVIYHLSTGTDLNYEITKYKARILLIYHNVTPPEFLAPYNGAAARLCRYGLDGARHLADQGGILPGGFRVEQEGSAGDGIQMSHRCAADPDCVR